MNLKDIIEKLTHLSEATQDTPTGKVHKAEPGGYGRKFDTDEEGDEKSEKKPEAKRGRGRPKKGSDETGDVKKYDWSAFGVKSGKDVKLPGPKGKVHKMDDKAKKASLKEYIEEAEQLTIEPAQQNTQVIKQGNKVLGSVTNPQLAAQIKQSIGKGEMTLAGGQLDEKWDTETKVSPEEKGKYAGKSKAELLKSYNELKKSGPHKKGSDEFGRMRELAFAIRAKSDWGKVKEADQPPQGSLASPLTFESSKQKVKEGAEHRLKAARHAGKSHALAKEGYNCRYEDMEEARSYHDGYKEGLDECYGQMPVQGLVVVGEETPAATVPGMADQEMDEGNAFTAALAKTPKGGKFSVGGKTFTDRTSYDAPVDEMAFESWDSQLTAILESKEVTEGMTVSVSQGQQGAPDSVSVTAQDSDAQELLGLIKKAGIGLFGGDQINGYGAPSGEVSAPGGIDVVDDNEGMMALMKRVGGGMVASADGDYEEEEDSHDGYDSEEACDTCGHSDCECDHEMVDEVESEDQMTYNVAEDNAPDSDEAETAADENAEAEEDKAAAEYDQSQKDLTVNESVKLDEWANEAGKRGTDAAFEADIDFMMNVISSGLNKRKSTGQTTVPVIAGQEDRMKAKGTTDINESVSDWKKLAGI